ncbi:MAG: hypothetical protein QUS14_16775, partial [Pyrinomonadaceae bacterium]|nr:hypothetical protein [Pyrinomonadaceae bacterium]
MLQITNKIAASVLLLILIGSANGSVLASKTVTVGVGKKVALKREKIAITFVAVEEDSRCPEGAECIWAGRASIRLVVSGKGKASRSVTLGSDADTNSVVFNNYRIKFVLLDPKPKAGTQTPSKSYRATLS